MIASPTQSRSIGDTWRDAARRLDAAGVDAPLNTARILLAHTLGKHKSWVIAHAKEQLSDSDWARFERDVQRLIAREPLFYVLGEREFYGLTLRVTPDVLVPRPETEMLVDLALQALSELPTPTAGPAVIDIGTGSGAIAIAIAHHAPHITVLATDISLAALRVARENAQRNDVENRVRFIQADLLPGLFKLPPIIVANLPYIAEAEIDGLPPEIQHHEPRIALDGGADGLALIRRLLKQIAQRREKEGPSSRWRLAFLEIGASQGNTALDAARHLIPDIASDILKDSAKLDRVLRLRAPCTAQ